jgi:hypothetical protein
MNDCAKKVLCRLIPLLASMLFLGGCAALPPLKPLDPFLEPAALEACRRPFLVEKVRLVHEMRIVMPGEREGQAIGVLLADPGTKSFQSVLMTIEGLVLFDIEYGAGLTVHRAVPPFDTPAFARRMAEDISLPFFSPGEKPAAFGWDKEGAAVCRFARTGGEFVDVRTAPEGDLEIRLYGTGQELRKKVIIPHPVSHGLAEELEIRGVAWPSYSLYLRLIEAEAVKD